MPQMYVRTYLPIADALALRLTSAGRILVEMPAEAGDLSAQLKHRLVTYSTIEPERADGRALTVTQLGWAGVLEALRAEELAFDVEQTRLRACIEYERASYRVALSHLRGGTYFEPCSMPPERRKGLLAKYWNLSPNYGRADTEAERLWVELEELRESEYRRLVTEADERLGDPEQHLVLKDGLASVDDTVAAVLRCSGAAPPRAKAIRDLAEQRNAEERQRRRDRVSQARRDLLVAHGTSGQVERFDANLLPEEELVSLARSVFFAPLDHLDRYERLTEEDIEHLDCCHPDPKFSSDNYDGPLTQLEWDALQRVRPHAPAGATVSVRNHSAWCSTSDTCEGGVVERKSVRVKLEWADLELVQGYAI